MSFKKLVCHNLKQCYSLFIQGFENIVSLLLNSEIDINAKQKASGETALIKVCYDLKLLLRLELCVSSTLINGTYSPFQACVMGHYPVVSMLLAQGADCQMRSVSGLTAAQMAAQSGHFEIRDLLESHSKKWVKMYMGCV